MIIIICICQGLYALLVHPQNKESEVSDATRSLTVARRVLPKDADDMKDPTKETISKYYRFNFL